MDLKHLQSSFPLEKWLADKTTVAVLEFLSQNCPFIGNRRPSDVNVVVNNEGAIQGFFDALKQIRSIANPVQEREKVQWQPYQKTAFPEPPQGAKPTDK